MSGNTRRLRSSKKLKQETCTGSPPIIVIEAGDVDSTTEKFSNDNQILSAILDANLPPNGDSGIEPNSTPVLSPELFCLDDVCSLHGETLSRPPSPENQTASECNMSLIVGEGPEVMTIRDLIAKVTMGHEIQICLQEEAFDVTNKQDFNIIWLQMSMPASQEILSLTTSIRYASKTNRNTVIIGFAAVVSMDLRLHGIDEIVVPPWTCHAVRHKYAKWTSVSLLSVEDSGSLTDDEKTHSATTVSSSCTTPINPATPSTPASVTSEDAERSCFSGMESPPTLAGLSQSTIPTFATLRNLVPNLTCTPVRPRHVHPNDHTTKEKLRRERIKDSCDQLRVLLPYVRGRKTDMASILEMCVEYLKIVNAALPQNFQNEIIDVLGRECKSPIGNKGRGRKCKKESMSAESPSTSAVTSTVEHDVNGNDQLQSSVNNDLYPFRSNQGPFMDTDNSAKRELPKNFMDMQPSKRFRLQAAADGFITATPCPSTMTANINNPGAFEALKLPRQDQTNNTDDSLPVVYPFHTISTHAPMYSDGDNASARLYNPHIVADSYTPANYFGPTMPAGKTGHERDAYGLFVDTNPLFHYYGGLHPSPLAQTYNTPNCNNIADYVNPNSVLPMSHNGRLKTETDKIEEQGDKSSLSSSNEDDSTTKRELEC